MIIWLTHLYEYGLPHAGIGSLPYLSLLEVEHLSHDVDEEGRGVRIYSERGKEVNTDLREPSRSHFPDIADWPCATHQWVIYGGARLNYSRLPRG